MCGRFSRFTGIDILESRFDIEINNLSTSLKSHYNIAPSDNIAVINRKNPLIIQDMKWGFIPFWSKTSNPKVAPINARAESLDNNMFKYAFENKRCIIPANGFYEWKKYQGRKIPHYIRPKNTRDDVFGFAGIYSTWFPKDTDTRQDATPLYSAAIITCQPNEQMSDIHDRMPVILSEQDEKTWLNQDANKDRLLDLLVPYGEELVIYPVSTYVNSPQNEGETCIMPVENPFRDPNQSNLDEFF